MAADERFEAVGRDPRFRRFPRRRDRAPGEEAGPAGGDERFAGLDAMLRAGRAREGAVDKRGRRQGKRPGKKKPGKPPREPEPAEAAAAEPKKKAKEAKEAKAKAKGKAKRRKAREPVAAAEGDPLEGPAPSASFSSGEVGGDPGGPGDAAGGRPDPARERVRGGQGPSAGYAARIRGADGASETTSATSSGLSLDAEDEDALLREAATSKLAEWGVGAVAGGAVLGAAEERVPEAAEPTARLAVVDLDWEHVTAQDIFTILHSFVPKGGALTRVTIYPSKYGLERMAQEARHGPQGIFEAKAGGGGGGDGVREEGFSDSEASSFSSSGEVRGRSGRRAGAGDLMTMGLTRRPTFVPTTTAASRPPLVGGRRQRAAPGLRAGQAAVLLRRRRVRQRGHGRQAVRGVRRPGVRALGQQAGPALCGRRPDLHRRAQGRGDGR